MFPNYGYPQVPGQPSTQPQNILTADGNIIAQIQNIATLMNQQGMVAAPSTVVPNNAQFTGPVPTQIIYNVPPNTVIPQMYPYIQNGVPGLAPTQATQYVVQPQISVPLGQQFAAPVNQITLPEGYNFVPAGSTLPNQLILAPAPVQQHGISGIGEPSNLYPNMFIPQFTDQQMQAFRTASNVANNNVVLNQLTTPMVVHQAPPQPAEDIVFPNNPPRRKRKSTSKKVAAPPDLAPAVEVVSNVQSTPVSQPSSEMPKLEATRPVLTIPKRESQPVVAQPVNLTPITPPPLLFRQTDDVSCDESAHASFNAPVLSSGDELESAPPILGREDDEMEDLSDSAEPPVLSLSVHNEVPVSRTNVAAVSKVLPSKSVPAPVSSTLASDCVPSTSTSNPIPSTSKSASVASKSKSIPSSSKTTAPKPATPQTKTNPSVSTVPSVLNPPIKLLSELKIEISPPPSPSSVVAEPATRSNSPREASVPVELYPDMPSPQSRSVEEVNKCMRKLNAKYGSKTVIQSSPSPPVTGNMNLSEKTVARMKRQLKRDQEKRERKLREEEAKKTEEARRLKTLEGKKPLVIREEVPHAPSPTTMKMIADLASAGMLQSIKVKVNPDSANEVTLVEAQDFQFSKPAPPQEQRSKVPVVAASATVAKWVKEQPIVAVPKTSQAKTALPPKKVEVEPAVPIRQLKIASPEVFEDHLLKSRKLENEFDKCPGMDTAAFVELMREIGPIIRSSYPGDLIVIKGINATVHSCGTFNKVMYDGFSDSIYSHWPMFNVAAVFTDPSTGTVLTMPRETVEKWIQTVTKTILKLKTVEIVGDNCIRERRLTVTHKASKAQLAVVFNSDVCIKRTFLIKSYCQIDPRITAMTRLLSNYLTKNHQLYQWTTTPMCYLVIAFMLKFGYISNLHEIDKKFIQDVNVLTMDSVPSATVTATLNAQKQSDSLSFLLYNFAEFCYNLDFSKVVIDISKTPAITCRKSVDDHAVIICCNYSGTNLAAQIRTKSVISFKRHMEFIVKSFKIGNECSIFSYPFKVKK